MFLPGQARSIGPLLKCGKLIRNLARDVDLGLPVPGGVSIKINRAPGSRVGISIALAFCICPSVAQKSGADRWRWQPPAHHSVDLTVVDPEAAAFSTKPLERLPKLMQQTVDRKQIAGIVTILARHGKVVDFSAYGVSGMANNTPINQDAIFCDYSVTKPVIGVAMMILTC